MEENIKIVSGFFELKQEWLRAKIIAGDFRGLGNAQRFTLSEEFGINPMKTAFDSIAPKNGKTEIEASIMAGETYCGSVYSLKDLFEEMKDINRLYKGEQIEIQLIKVQWNKKGTDADRSNIGEYFIFKPTPVNFYKTN